MKKVNTFALIAVLAVCFVFPMNAFSQAFARYAGSGRTQQTTTNQAVATTCSQSVPGVYSEKASFHSVSLGATWSAVFQMVAMMLGQLNANARAETNSRHIAGVKYEDISINC